VRGVDQFLEDAAVGDAVAALALRVQRAKLLLQFLKRLSFRLYSPQMRAERYPDPVRAGASSRPSRS
jgi:hypothetical protein